MLDGRYCVIACRVTRCAIFAIREELKWLNFGRNSVPRDSRFVGKVRLKFEGENLIREFPLSIVRK